MPATGGGRVFPPASSARRGGGLACGGCGGPIVGRIVSAMGVRWHPGCFRCSDCNDLLEYVSSYERDGKPYCHFDYHEVLYFHSMTNRRSPLSGNLAFRPKMLSLQDRDRGRTLHYP